MKNNQILAALTGFFFLCSLVTFYKVVSYRSSLRLLGEAESHAAYVRTVEGPVINSLVNDTVEYSKKDPAVVPILQALTNSASKPVTNVPKPAAK
jgi:hypothetical protein